MRKWVKVLIVIALMICSASVTCYVFFNNLKKSQAIDYTITNYLSSGERDIFIEELKLAKTNCGDSRLTLVYDTYTNLEEILTEQNYYLINYQPESKSMNKIKSDFNRLSTNRARLYDIMKEYNLKCSSSTAFNKQIGANDLFVEFSHHFVDYSQFIRNINNQLSKKISSTKTDIKFSVIDLYGYVVENSFSKVISDSNLNTLSTNENINYINRFIDFKNGQLQTKTNYFGQSSSKFILNYEAGDKNVLANNLYRSVISIGTNISTMNNNELTFYYFKEIFGV